MTVPGILRPSNAGRWSVCPGSFALEALYPEDEDSPAAREGTAAHFYVTEAIQGRVHPVGTITPNGHPLDAEMIEAGQCYVEDVLEAWGTPRPNPVAFGVEQRLTMHGLVHPDNEGTPDTYLLDFPGKLLIVWDYKYGHRYVEVFRNKQLTDYVAGVFEAHELTREDVADLTVIIRVVQPRNYSATGPIREWRTTGAEIWPLIEQLAVAAEAAKQPGAPTLTGPQCRDCNAAHACEALRRVGGYVLDLSGSSVPAEMPPDALGISLRQIETGMARLSALQDALTEVAMGELRKGATIPGWTIGHGSGRKRWSVPVSEVLAMGAMYSVDLAKPADAITPVQAAKLKIDAAVIEAYSETPSGAAKLVPQDATSAARAFTRTS